jgi:hypothetical protein
MLELLGLITGGIFRLLPEELKILSVRSDADHEYRMTELQLKVDQARAAQAIDLVDAQGAAAADAAELGACGPRHGAARRWPPVCAGWMRCSVHKAVLVAVGLQHARPVRLTDPPLSREAAERRLLGYILQVDLPSTQALCPGLQGRALAAITDFAFNLGLTRLKASTLRRRLLAGDLDWRGLRRNVRVTPAQSTLRNTTEHSEKPRESTL